MPFYIRDLSICGFWYLRGTWNQSPMNCETTDSIWLSTRSSMAHFLRVSAGTVHGGVFYEECKEDFRTTSEDSPQWRTLHLCRGARDIALTLTAKASSNMQGGNSMMAGKGRRGLRPSGLHFLSARGRSCVHGLSPELVLLWAGSGSDPLLSALEYMLAYVLLKHPLTHVHGACFCLWL